MSASPPISFAAIDCDNPWPGLATFTEDQRAYFHGRDEEIIDLTQLAERRPLVVLFGQSGLGKSSILQAGVFPRMRTDGFCPIYIRLDHGDAAPSPTEQIKAMVRTETAKWGTWTKPGVAQPGETLWEFFHHRDDRLLDRDGLGVVPVLVFDQFEELFTLGAARGERRERAVAFMKELAELVENRPSAQLVARLDQSSAEMEAFDFGRTDYRVIISLREDFLPDLETLKTIMPALMQKRMRLSRMTGTQALEAVLKPGGALVTDDVARAIVEFVAGARGGSAERLAELDVEPALLSVICRELNERRRALGQAQITADLVTGNRREILTDFYERSVADLPAGMRTFVEDHLLTKSGFRDNLALETALEFSGVTQPLIDTLVARRLLRIEDRGGIQRVELTHDVLAEVIRAARDARQQRVALEQAQERERRVLEAGALRARRLRWVVVGLVAAVVIVASASFLVIRTQRDSALVAQRLAAQRGSHTDLILASRLFTEGKTADGLAYLVRAARRDPENPVLAPRLLTALVGGNFLLPKQAPLSLPSPTLKQKYSADGRTLFAQGEDGVLRAIDTNAWRVLRTFTFERPVALKCWSLAEKNPQVLAVGFDDGSIQICDAVTGAPRMPPFRPKEEERSRRMSPTLSPDGKWVAAGEDDKLWLWDAETGEQRAVLPTYLGEIRFSPDNRCLATLVPTGQGQSGGNLINRPQLWELLSATRLGNPLGAGSTRFVQMEFAPDGRSILVRIGATATLFDCESGAAIRPPLQLDPRASIRGFTPDGTRFIVAGDRDVRVIDAVKGEVVFPPLIHGGPIVDIEVRQGGSVLFTNSVEGISRLWDLQTGALRAETTLQQAHYTPATLSPDGTRVVLFSTTGPVYGFDLGQGAAQPLSLPRAPNEVRSEFLQDAPHLLLRMLLDRAIAVDVASGLEGPGGFAFPRPLTSERSIYSRILFSPDQRTLIAKLAGSAWQVWKRGPQGTISGDIVLENLAANPLGNHPTNDVVAFSGPQLANGRSAGVWSLATGKRIAEMKHESGIYGGFYQGAQVSADGRRVGFKTLDDAVHVCDFPSGAERFVLRFSGRSDTFSWRFSPDGARIITADRWGGVVFSDAADGRLVKSGQRHRARADAVDFSSDGRRVISRSEDGTAQVWDVATGSEVGPLLVHSGAVTSSAFSPDGKRVVTGTTRGEVRIWETTTGQPLTEPMRRGAGGSLQEIQFSPDGRFFATVGNGRYVWAMPPDGGGTPPPEWLLRLATIAAGKRLTDDGEFVEASEELGNVAKVRDEVAALPETAPYVEWGRWFLSDSPTRSIAPGFTITPADAEKLAQEMAAVPATAPPATVAPAPAPRP